MQAPSDPARGRSTPRETTVAAPGAGAPGRAGDSFGARLRRERERRKISISTIAESTKILGALLEGLENDDVSRWPTGFYRRAFIRAYATAIGLDPEPVVREFSARFPDPEETVALPAPAAASATAAAPPAPERTERRPVRLTLVAERTAFAPGAVLRRLRQRVNALVLDAFAVGVAALAMFLLLEDFWAPLAFAIAVYYGASILLLGNTPGVCLFASPGDRTD